jgi:hypothetical protein
MVMTFDGKTRTVVKNGKTEDIIAALIAAVPEAVRQFKNNKPTTHTGNLIKDATNACMFVRDRVKYKADGFNFQDIQFPGRMLFHTKQADCKSFSLAALANLLSQGYNGGFRFASYRPNKVPTHVYIFVLDKSGKKFTFDPCIKNLKESNKATHIIDMDVRYLSEPIVEIAGREERRARRQERREARQERREDRREARQERREDRKERRASGDKPKALPKVTLAPARGAFLGLTALNFRGLATRIDKAIKKDSKKVQDFWNKLGGDFSKLKSNVEKNKGKKPLFGQGKGIDGLSFSDEFISEMDYNNIGTFEDYYIGVEPATTTAAAAATASPILLALKKLLASLKVEDVVDAAGKVVPLLKPNEEAATTPIDATGEGFQASDPEPGSNQKTTGGASFAPSPMLIGGLAGAAVLIYFLTKKKRK